MMWPYRRLKTNREEKFTKHVGFVYAYVKKAKIRKINDEKGGDKQKKKTHNRPFKARPVLVCECAIVILKVLY